MSSLTDPRNIKATVKAIYEGGREHPLADLARLIDQAISEARFQGLGEFDVARWVAHAITEDQNRRIAEHDKTAPHGQFVANPPGLFDFLTSLPNLPRVDTGDQPSMFEAFKVGKLSFGATPELPPFPVLDLSGIPDMPEHVKANLEAAAEQIREGVQGAAEHIRERLNTAAEQPHEHEYGRGANGRCRICGTESRNGRKRRLAREKREREAAAARKFPQHLPSERVEAVIAFANGTHRQGTVIAPADHQGWVTVHWHDREIGHVSAVHVHQLSAPASRLHEALKAKGDGEE